MIISYSGNPIKEAFSIVFYNWARIAVFIIFSTIAFVCCHVLEIKRMELPVVPVSILGGALAIFLGFRNSAAYDRWWEARKIWGAIVNSSRSFAMQLNSYATAYEAEGITEKNVDGWKKELVHRHLAWLNGLRLHLRREKDFTELEKWISPQEYALVTKQNNLPVQLLNLQGLSLKRGFEKNYIETFRLFELVNTLDKLYDHQGAAERIKGTVFPFYYNYFTRLFLWLFVLCLPFAIVNELGWLTIPMSVSISFVFSILEKSGTITEDPFEGKAADTPMNSICRNIEIDMLQIIQEDEIPEPLPVSIGRFGVKFQK